mmetsp:Transcript_11344/g.21410  ORF Transcript_11344/g.21410 Transcript_11344/m.21410 type:complete len:121 (-) Transcript_11344:185-547(-)
MGAHACTCNCNSNGQEGEAGMEYMQKEKFVHYALPAYEHFPEPSCRLDGQWYHAKENVMAAEIENMVCVFPAKTPVLCPLEMYGPSQVHLLLDGHSYFGEFCLAAQATITWSDGEIWLRK